MPRNDRPFLNLYKKLNQYEYTRIGGALMKNEGGFLSFRWVWRVFPSKIRVATTTFQPFWGGFLEWLQKERELWFAHNSLILKDTHEWTRTITMLLTRTWKILLHCVINKLCIFPSLGREMSLQVASVVLYYLYDVRPSTRDDKTLLL